MNANTTSLQTKWLRQLFTNCVILFGFANVVCAQVPGICLPNKESPYNRYANNRQISIPGTSLSSASQPLRMDGVTDHGVSDPRQAEILQYLNQYGYREVSPNQPVVASPVANPQGITKNLPNPHASTMPYMNQSTYRVHGSDSSLAPHSLASSIRVATADDPLSSLGPDATAEKERAKRKADANDESNAQPKGIDPHLEVFANTLYPSAQQCAKCHKKIYDEWRVSGHAYATVSPMFQRFEQAVADLLRGTAGTFCVRCHAPVATQAGFPREAAHLDGPLIYREGISCIACHRVVERYGRVNGERRIEPGSIYDPVVGNSGGDGVPAVLQDAENWKVTTDPNDKRPRQAIHRGAIQFEQLADSSFCAGCHQVVVQPGIALEVVYQQYRTGPAHKRGVSCQDCHMGIVPGKPNGYETGACAEVTNKVFRNDRKHSNHIFHGPSYPIAHPGLFPHNEKALRWTAKQWLEFDWRAGWGTDSFEKTVAANPQSYCFPDVWKNAQERRDAMKIVEENRGLVGIKYGSAIQTLENGSRIDGPFFDSAPSINNDLNVRFVVNNTSEGHNMPSGSLGAQPQLWLNVVLIGPNGEWLWESGDLDSNGDMRDLHSLDVRAKKLPPDSQLFNMQTKFLITNLKGTEREMYLPVPVDIDPLPFFRPGQVPYTVLNHPPFIRMEAHSIPPLDSRTARYRIPGGLIQQPGIYRISARMRSRVEPVYFMKFVGATPDMIRSLNESIIDVHPFSREFIVR